ncbi:MAG: ATP-binding protein [Bacteroidales bacterium]|nr:ATP-binding protein [Candidatus Physcocola equi]
MIIRTLQQNIQNQIGKGKVIALMGARQVGKSTLSKQLLGDRNDVLWLNGDDADTRTLLSNMSSTRLRSVIGNKKYVVIDEAQRITNIGLVIKLVSDQIPDVQLIATGSSSFELANKINEPLTGRKREYTLFPFSFKEMVESHGLLDETRLLPHRLVFGYYPEVVTSPGDEKIALKELVNSYLYRDMLSFDRIKNADGLQRLVKALALQIGCQISYNEIANLIGLSAKTVEHYIDILEKCFIVFRLNSFAKNLRNELKASKKIYFWDLGIRNAVIGNLSQIENRSDVGELWENFLISEKMKMLSYSNSFAQTYFWRTKQQQEIDFLQEEDGILQTFEFKWNDKKIKTKQPETFKNAYPDATYKVITPSNVEDFLL